MTSTDKRITQLSDALFEGGPAAFYAQRKKIQKQLTSESSKTAWHRLYLIEKSMLPHYTFKCLEPLTQLPSDHRGQYLGQKIGELISSSRPEIEWMRQVYYGSYGRGLYNHGKRRVYIDILPPGEYLPVLIHEIEHKLDKLLAYSRSRNIDKDYLAISHLLAKPKKSLRPADKIKIGKYFFARYAYEGWYKEAKPRLTACQVFRDLHKINLLSQPSSTDVNRFSPVLKGTESCEQLTRKELRSQYEGPPDYYWKKGSFHYQMVKSFARKWERENGFRSPIYLD